METNKDAVFVLPISCADIGVIESELNKKNLLNNEISYFKLDMTNVEYITASSLIYLIAITYQLIKKNIIVKYNLPLSIDVRNIMRIWRFPIVLKEVTNKSFASIVSSKDLKYFGESTLSGDYYNQIANSDDGLAEQIKKDFFSIVSIPFNVENEKSIAISKQHNKWSEDIVKAILKRHLESYDNDKDNVIPNRIIYECMTNAFRHSEAVNLVTGAFFDKKGKVLTVTYWDNGRSIIDTLEEVLIQNAESGCFEPNNNDFQFSFCVKSEIKDEPIEYFHSHNKLGGSFSKGEVLLYSFCPGITRDPDGKLAFTGNPFLSKVRPGMGLPTLLNATIDLLNGSVAVRTGSYFVNFKKASISKIKAFKKKFVNFDDRTLYSAKLVKLENMPHFEGNMITVRLPLK